MPKTWQRHQAKKFIRDLKLGQPYYVVMEVARNVAPYEDRQLYSEYVFTDRLPFTGDPCTEYGASASTLCQNFGPMYDAPPSGMRNVAGPGPQVSGPLPQGYEGNLDEAEIRGLEKRVRDGSDPRTRRSPRSWRL